MIEYPVLRVLPLNTRGRSLLHKFKVWLWKKPRRFKLEEDFKLYVPFLYGTLFVPKGFITNCASVPMPLWPVISPTGILLLGSIIHDFMYTYGKLLIIREGDDDITICNMNRALSDEYLSQISTYVNEIPIQATVIRVVMALVGWVTWNNCRRENRNLIEDFPMLGDCHVEDLQFYK